MFGYSPNKRSCWGPGGVARGLEPVPWAKTCARKRASVVSTGPPGGLPWPSVDDGTDDIYSSKVSYTTLGPKFKCPSTSIIKLPFRIRTDISAW